MVEKKICSKCGKEVFMGLCIERKRLFRRSKTKKWCFSCYNKSRFSVGKFELKEVVITGEKMGDMFIGDNIILPSTPSNRLQVPKEDVIPKPYTKLNDIKED